MKKLIILFVLILTLGLAGQRAEADSITYYLNTALSGSGVSPITSVGTLTFTDSGNYVKISVQLTDPNYKILSLDLNFNDQKFSNYSDLTLVNESLKISENAIKADGYKGSFDLAIPRNGNIGEYGSYFDTIKWNKGHSNLSINDFTFKDSDKQVYAALHIGNYSNGSSIWVGATDGPLALPEPSMLLLLGLGLISVPLVGKKLKPAAR